MPDPLVVEYALSLWQPWADLCVTPDPEDPSVPVKPVENRGWTPPSTLPQWFECNPCGAREIRPRRGNARHDCSPAGTWWRQGPFPFRLAIHAAATGASYATSLEQLAWDTWGELHGVDGYEVWANHAASDPVWQEPDVPRLVFGALVGFVTVTGCHHADECGAPVPAMTGVPTFHYCSVWAQPDVYHWTLADPEPLDEPIPMRGRQKLWRLPEAVTADG